MKKILIILATIGLLYSCSNDDSNENLNLNEDFVVLSADTLSAGPQGGDLEVTIESTYSGAYPFTFRQLIRV